MSHSRVTDLGFYAVEGVARILTLPKSGIVDIQGACLLQFPFAPLAVIGWWCFWFFQPPALSPTPVTSSVLAYVPHKAFHAPVVNVQIFTSGQAHALPALVTPQFLQSVPAQSLRVLDNGVVVVTASNGTVLLNGAVLCCRYPLGAGYVVLVAPAVQAFHKVSEIQIGSFGVSRLRQVGIVIGSSPGIIPLSEVSIYKLDMITLCPVIVVGLLGQ